MQNNIIDIDKRVFFIFGLYLSKQSVMLKIFIRTHLYTFTIYLLLAKFNFHFRQYLIWSSIYILSLYFIEHHMTWTFFIIIFILFRQVDIYFVLKHIMIQDTQLHTNKKHQITKRIPINIKCFFKKSFWDKLYRYIIIAHFTKIYIWIKCEQSAWIIDFKSIIK